VATDEHGLTQIENDELQLALSLFIGVYLWPDCFFWLGRDRFFQATGFTIYCVDDLTQNLIC